MGTLESLLRTTLPLAAAVLLGCTTETLRTVDVPSATSKAVRGQPYFLPRAVLPVTVIVSKTPPAPPKSAEKGGDAPGKGAGSDTADPPAQPKGGEVKPPPTPTARDGANSASDAESSKRFVTLKIGEPKLIPDVSAAYFLEYNDEWSSDDTFKLRVDASGLLQASEATSRDRSGDSFLKLVEFASEAAKISARFSMLSALAQPSPTPAACSLEEQSIELLVDLKEGSTAVGVATVLISAQRDTVTAVGRNPQESGRKSGVKFRGVALFKIEATINAIPTCDVAKTVAETFAVGPSETAAFWVDTKRAALVEKKIGLVVKDGMLVGLDVTKPSQTLAILSVPVDALKTIAAIPGELLSIKVNQIKGESSLTTEQANAIAAQIKLIEQQKALEAAQQPSQ